MTSSTKVRRKRKKQPLVATWRGTYSWAGANWLRLRAPWQTDTEREVYLNISREHAAELQQLLTLLLNNASESETKPSVPEPTGPMFNGIRIVE